MPEDQKEDEIHVSACLVMGKACLAETPLEVMRTLAELIEPRFLNGRIVERRDKYLCVRAERDDEMRKPEMRGVEFEGFKIESDGPFHLLQAGLIARKEHLLPNKISRNLILNTLDLLLQIFTEDIAKTALLAELQKYCKPNDLPAS